MNTPLKFTLKSPRETLRNFYNRMKRGLKHPLKRARIVQVECFIVR